MKRLIVASKNQGKIREIKALAGEEYEVVSMTDAGFFDEIEENGSTFTENALIKARAIYAQCKAAVVADDSGLEVDYLDGAPGIYSARFAGGHDDEKNNEKLLRMLKDTENRTARFVSAVAYVDDERTVTTLGTVDGEILREKRGKGGFGYDPLFYCYELSKSFGEATDEEKNSVSHRARAFSELFRVLSGHSVGADER